MVPRTEIGAESSSKKEADAYNSQMCVLERLSRGLTFICCFERVVEWLYNIREMKTKKEFSNEKGSYLQSRVNTGTCIVKITYVINVISHIGHFAPH